MKHAPKKSPPVKRFKSISFTAPIQFLEEIKPLTKAHNQEIKIKELEKENKILKNQVKELKDKIAKLNSDIKFKDMQISIKELAEKNNKMMNTSLTFLTIAQYLLFAVVILSIIGWIISMFKKRCTWSFSKFNFYTKRI